MMLALDARAGKTGARGASGAGARGAWVTVAVSGADELLRAFVVVLRGAALRCALLVLDSARALGPLAAGAAVSAVYVAVLTSGRTIVGATADGVMLGAIGGVAAGGAT